MAQKKVKNPSSRCNIQCSGVQHMYSLASFTTGYLPYRCQWRVATSLTTAVVQDSVGTFFLHTLL